MAGPDPASDESEARWNYAFFLQTEVAIVGDPARDPAGARLVEAWAKDQGYWYSDEEEDADFDATVERAERLTEAFVALTVKAVKQLHEQGDVRSVFGRTLPLLIHELEYYDEIADQNVAANPPGAADDFARWCRTLSA